jgi:hypothetical protein
MLRPLKGHSQVFFSYMTDHSLATNGLISTSTNITLVLHTYVLNI